MITVFHGTDQVKSRLNLNQELTGTVIKLNAARLSPEDLTQALESSLLFETKQIIFIDNLFSLPQSQNKSKLIDILLSHPDSPVFLWEKKPLTPAVAKKLSGQKARLVESKLPPVIFKFLDSLKPKNFHDSLKASAPEQVFYLLTRRLANLIAAKDDPASVSGAPWQKANLVTQAKAFDLATLFAFHRGLLALDIGTKTGSSLLPLKLRLELMLVNLL